MNQIITTKKCLFFFLLLYSQILGSYASTGSVTRPDSHFHSTGYSLTLDLNESLIKDYLTLHSWRPELNPWYERGVISDTCWSNWRTTATSKTSYWYCNSIQRSRKDDSTLVWELSRKLSLQRVMQWSRCSLNTQIPEIDKIHVLSGW